MLTILGLDQSLRSTGVVIQSVMTNSGKGKNVTEIEYWGAIKTEKGQEDYIFDTLERGNQIITELGALIRTYKPDVICFEGLSLNSKGNATRTLPMLLGIILRGIDELIWSYDIKVYYVAPKSLKKFATGNGNSGKKAMFQQLQLDAPELHKELAGKPINIGRYDITDAFYLAQQGYVLHTQQIEQE